MRVARTFVEATFPRTCLCCGDLPVQDFPVCPTCALLLERVTPPVCARCGVPLDGPDVQRCQSCLMHPPDFRRAAAVFEYGGLARDLVLRLKYGREFHLSRPLGLAMAAAAHGARLGAMEGSVVVPVPLTPARLYARGYNQAALLGKTVARAAGLDFCPGAMRRVRDPGPQGHHTRRERQERVAGCFAVTGPGKQAIAGREVLLCDDVMTTGATTSECARVLLAAGASAVDVVVFARARK